MLPLPPTPPSPLATAGVTATTKQAREQQASLKLQLDTQRLAQVQEELAKHKAQRLASSLQRSIQVAVPPPLELLCHPSSSLPPEPRVANRPHTRAAHTRVSVGAQGREASRQWWRERGGVRDVLFIGIHTLCLNVTRGYGDHSPLTRPLW